MLNINKTNMMISFHLIMYKASANYRIKQALTIMNKPDLLT